MAKSNQRGIDDGMGEREQGHGNKVRGMSYLTGKRHKHNGLNGLLVCHKYESSWYGGEVGGLNRCFQASDSAI